jgi:hypothetical protein
MDGQMDGHGETSIPPYNFVEGGITTLLSRSQQPLKISDPWRPLNTNPPSREAIPLLRIFFS